MVAIASINTCETPFQRSIRKSFYTALKPLKNHDKTGGGKSGGTGGGSAPYPHLLQPL